MCLDPKTKNNMIHTKNELIDILKYCADSIKIYGDKDGYLDDHHMKLIVSKLSEVTYYHSKELNRREVLKQKKGYEYKLLKHLREKYPDEDV